MIDFPKTYPHWIYDDSPIDDPFGFGERAVNFIKHLKHPKSDLAKNAFVLDPWQERIVRRIYAPRHDNGTRIIKTVFAMIPRGNRKTSLGAALTLLHTIGPERTQGGEVICAAADKKQARIAYKEAKGIINEDKRLIPLVIQQDYRSTIIDKRSNTTLEAISADASTQHGRTPTFTLMDELHAWPNHKLWEALKTGLLKTKGSLNVIITTAGRGQENIAFETYAYARKVALGEINDPATLPIILEAPSDCDWRNEENWHMVNLGLKHGYPDLEGLRQFAREAENRPSERESFRQLNLNVWLDHSADPFIEMDIYDKTAEPKTAPQGAKCWIGVDMSTTTDLTAVIACVVDDEENYIIIPQFFVPSDNLRNRAERDGVPYPEWARQGFIHATSGNVIDYKAVEDCIRDLCNRFDVQEIGFDPAYAQAVMTPLLGDGLPVVTIRQGWVTQSPALNELERVILAGRFFHSGNPVLRWCFSNVAIHKDSAGNRTMHKGKSTDRIDGAVATWMAVSRAAASEEKTVYDSSEWTEEMAFF